MGDLSSQEQREIRAGRNQSLFRTINENLKELNDAMPAISATCECADANCIEILEIAPTDYEAVRAEPRHFVVLPGHVYPEVETVVRETRGYVVVEKIAAAADVAEVLSEG